METNAASNSSPSDALRLEYTKKILTPLSLYSFPNPSLLNSNQRPTEMENLWIRSQLEETTKRLEILDDELRIAETLSVSGEEPSLSSSSSHRPWSNITITRNGKSYTYFQYLATERLETSNYINHLKTISSSVRKLNSDILREIFLWRLNDDVNNQAVCVNPLREDSAQCRLAYVCRRWRDVVLALHPFWTRQLSVDLEQYPPPIAPEPLEHMDRVLKWFYPRPLSISIRFHSFDNDKKKDKGKDKNKHKNTSGDGDGSTANPITDDAEPPQWTDYSDHPIIRLLTSQSSRWQHISLDIKSYDCLTALQQIHGHLPLLESLRVTGYASHDREKGPKPILNMFEIAPKLHSIESRAILLDDLRLPWAQITTMKGDTDEPLIHQTPNLVTAELGASFLSSGTLQHLRNLTTNFYNYPKWITPSLETLCLPFGCIKHGAVVSGAYTPLLRDLYVDSSSGHYDHYTQITSALPLLFCLRSLPNLTHLSMKYLDQIYNETFAALIPKDKSPTILPHLEKISLQSNWITISDVMLECFERRATGRVPNVSILKVIKLRGPYRCTDLHR